MRDNPAPRHGPGHRQGVHQPDGRLSGRHARRARHVRAWRRSRGESAPGNDVAADRAYHQRCPGQRDVSRDAGRSRRPQRRTAHSCARSSRPRIPNDMASGSATISSDARRLSASPSFARRGGARSCRTSRPVIPTQRAHVELLAGLRSGRRGRRSSLGCRSRIRWRTDRSFRRARSSALEQGMNFDAAARHRVARARVDSARAVQLSQSGARGRRRRARRAPRRRACTECC